MPSKRTSLAIVLIAMLASVGPRAFAAAGEPKSATARCSRLSLTDIPDVTILSATSAAGSDHVSLEFPGRTVPLSMLLGGARVVVPGYCQIRGYIRPAIHFDVRLPTRAWNGKFYMAGCAGLCGRLDSPEQLLGLTVGLSRHYAVATTDTGHWGSSNQDGRWAYGNPVARDDYASRGIHETARVAKILIRNFYDAAPSRSYFEGCSNGGRQGLMEASRFPEDFDGVIAGAPGVDFLGTAAQFTWLAQADRDSRGAPIFSPSKLELLQSAVQKACRNENGVIEDPAACRFDPASLQCSTNTDGAACLSAAEVGVLRKWYSPPTLKSGVKLFPAGLPYGSEPFWASSGGVNGGPKTIAASFLRYVLPPLGESYDVATFNLDTDLPRIAAQANAYRPSADLTAFKARGGKVLIYHGLADAWIPFAGSVVYFEAVERALGGRHSTRDTARLFLIPGWDHCGIGGFAKHPGPDLGLFGFAGLGALPALQKWVERGVAPASLTATKYEAGHTVRWTRPLCPYPQRAQYSGTGNRSQAANWRCAEASMSTSAEAANVPWKNSALSPDARAAALVKAMTIDEKIHLLHGSFGWVRSGQHAPQGSLGGEGYLTGIARLGIPDLQLIDGALGVTNLGKRPKGEATAMPSSLSLVASFDTNLAYETGAVVGREARDQGFNVLLGGGVNIEREARNGRNFEYFGEDPLLAGKMVAAQLRAVQDQHVVATIKHYALNTQETDRYGINAVADERSLREVDLLPFEIAVKQSGVGSVMCAYNRVNGVYSCENDYLLNKVLKAEWGFKGWVMSDWGATHSTVAAANAGLDQEFPASQFFARPLAQAVQHGQVTTQRLDDMVHRILRTLFAVGVVDNPPTRKPIDAAADLAVAQKAAERGIVLLRNNEGLLPLDVSKLRSVAIIGKHADVGVLSGGGSTQVDPIGGKIVDPPANRDDPIAALFAPTWDLSSPLKAIQARIPTAQVSFDSGVDPSAAERLAASSDVTIVFAYEHRREGLDVSSLSLPDGQDELIERVAAANRHTIVVLETGGPCLTPWAERVAAILEAWYPGNRGAEAIAAVLFGEVNPTARLPITFPEKETDLPRAFMVGFPDQSGVTAGRTPPRLLDVTLAEGLKVGYKWFDSQGKVPQFPFGFGLSYTSFGYSNLEVTTGKAVRVTFDVKNTGRRLGTDVAQIYVELPHYAREPPRRLAGWALVTLEPGETKAVSVDIGRLALSIWDVRQGRWQTPAGEYRFYVGSSSRDLPLHRGIGLGASGGCSNHCPGVVPGQEESHGR